MNYYSLSEDIGTKARAIRRDKKGDYIPLLDKHYEKLQEVSGLDIGSYILSTEPAFRQPQRPINAEPIKEALKNKGIKNYALSIDLYASSPALDNYIRKGSMPMHKAKELCDVLGIDHEEVIVEEMEK